MLHFYNVIIIMIAVFFISLYSQVTAAPLESTTALVLIRIAFHCRLCATMNATVIFAMTKWGAALVYGLYFTLYMHGVYSNNCMHACVNLV